MSEESNPLADPREVAKIVRQVEQCARNVTTEERAGLQAAAALLETMVTREQVEEAVKKWWSQPLIGSRSKDSLDKYIAALTAKPESAKLAEQPAEDAVQWYRRKERLDVGVTEYVRRQGTAWWYVRADGKDASGDLVWTQDEVDKVHYGLWLPIPDPFAEQPAPEAVASRIKCLYCDKPMTECRCDAPDEPSRVPADEAELRAELAKYEIHAAHCADEIERFTAERDALAEKLKGCEAKAARSTNYIANDPIRPSRVIFSNGRVVTLGFDGHWYLDVSMSDLNENDRDVIADASPLIAPASAGEKPSKPAPAGEEGG